MRTAHVDCANGASGEMWLGALIDAGASLEAVQDAVERLGPGDVRITFGRVRRAGSDAVAVRVRPPADTRAPTSWPAVRTILEEAGLEDAVRDRAHAVFRHLFEAEAETQGVGVETVRLTAYEGLDLLGDVVGTCVGLADLAIVELTAGPVDADAELTGAAAAFLTALTSPVATPPELDVERVGVGAGVSDLAHPAVLRVLVGRRPTTARAVSGRRRPRPAR